MGYPNRKFNAPNIRTARVYDVLQVVIQTENTQIVENLETPYNGDNVDTFVNEPFQGVSAIMVGNPNHPRGGIRPVFNTCPPFNGVITVQMNESFANLLSNFIGDISGDIEKELLALKRSLEVAKRECSRARREPYHNNWPNDNGDDNNHDNNGNTWNNQIDQPHHPLLTG